MGARDASQSVKRTSMKKMAIILALLLIGSCSTTTNNESLEYIITPDKVSDVYTHEFADGHVITIQLAEPYKTEFADLTGNNIGQRLTIVFNGNTLTSAIIKAKIHSGSIGAGGNMTEDEAKDLVQELKGSQ